jgi:hypothetical protein
MVFICKLAMDKMIMIHENPGYTAWIASGVVFPTTPGCPTPDSFPTGYSIGIRTKPLAALEMHQDIFGRRHLYIVNGLKDGNTCVLLNLLKSPITLE